MIRAAIPNLTVAITMGWATINPIFVAVDAEAQKIAKVIPAKNQLYCLLNILQY
jgi:hypothetical protein